MHCECYSSVKSILNLCKFFWAGGPRGRLFPKRPLFALSGSRGPHGPAGSGCDFPATLQAGAPRFGLATLQHTGSGSPTTSRTAPLKPPVALGPTRPPATGQSRQARVLGQMCKMGSFTSSNAVDIINLLMDIQTTIQDKRGDILRLAALHGVADVRLFGSVARGDARSDSDVDFLVRLEPGHTLFDLGALLMDLQDLLGRKVDLVTEKGLHWYIRDRILREAIRL